MKIFINPGHGGIDTGACGNGLIERDVVLVIGRLVAKYLRNVGYDVKAAQIDDLQEICDAANSWNADLFVSIHCNAGGGMGTETYHFYGSTAGNKLATCINNQLVKSLPLRNRGVKQKGYYVLAATDAPAALVETAFIDCETDADLLAHCPDEFARAIARGITDFFA